MQLLTSKKALFVLVIALLTWYTVYISNNESKLQEFETKHSTIGKINSTLRDIYEKVTGKSEEISSNSKELYEKNLAPKINDIKSGVEIGINTTKEKVDNVRKSLSGAEDTLNKTKEVINKGTETINQATEVFNDINKMGDTIINSVNTGTVSNTLN